jgi:hypothetical protein
MMAATLVPARQTQWPLAVLRRFGINLLKNNGRN